MDRVAHPHAVRCALLVAAAIYLCACAVAATAHPRESGCADRHTQIRLTLQADGSIGADYALNQATKSLPLGLPGGRSDGFRLEPAQASMDADGAVVLPKPAQRFRILLSAEPPERRWAGAYPLAFHVAGRGTGVFLPYLLPEACGDTTVLLQGGPNVAALIDGEYRRLERDYEVADATGFLLLGANLSPDSTLQLPTTLPAWLAAAIGDSYLVAQDRLPELLQKRRRDVPVLVDFSGQGAGSTPRNGGDATRGHCAMRLWFRGGAWQDPNEDLRTRMHDVLVHELVHCYQEPDIWQQWAHEGHARFVELLLGAGSVGESPAVYRAQERLALYFDTCMNALRVSERDLDAYACGAVAYWLRWLEAGRVSMLAETDAESGAWARSMPARFLTRSVTEAEVVDFVREAGVTVEAVEDVREPPDSVRARLIHTLLRRGCGGEELVGPRGFWTNAGSVTLDAPPCPALDRFELETVAGRHIIEDVYAGYAETASSCRNAGRVLAAGVNGEQVWVQCDRSYAWPSVTGTRYRLVAPFRRPG